MSVRPISIASLVAGAVLAGCQAAPSPAPPTVTPAPAAPVAAESAAPAAPTLQGPTLSGEARWGSAPFADGAVEAIALDGAVQAAGRTDAQGAFALAWRAPAPAGALIKLVAHRDGKTLATLASAPAAPAAFAVRQAPAVTLDLPSTLAYISLLPRLALLGASPAPRALPPVLSAFQDLTAAAAQPIAAAPASALDALGTALAPNGEGSLPAPVAGRFVQGAPGFQSAFLSAAQGLTTAITSHQQGASVPALVFGPAVAAGNRGSSGRGGGPSRPSDLSVEVTVGSPQEGSYASPAAPEAGQAE